VDDALLDQATKAIEKAGGHPMIVAKKAGGVRTAGKARVAADGALDGTPSFMVDAVMVLGSDKGVEGLLGDPAALDWLRNAWRHLKAIGLDAAGQQLAKAAGIGSDDAVIDLTGRKGLPQFLRRAAQGKHFAREGAPGTDA